MEAIDAGSQEFKALTAYANDTHGVTHSHMKINIQHAYRVERRAYILSQVLVKTLMSFSCRESETEAWHRQEHHKLEDGRRMLLWHGSRTTNFAGTL